MVRKSSLQLYQFNAALPFRVYIALSSASRMLVYLQGKTDNYVDPEQYVDLFVTLALKCYKTPLRYFALDCRCRRVVAK